MLPKKRVPTHPGEILLEEFLLPLEVTQKALAEHLGVPIQRVNEIVRGRRGVSSETAWLFAEALGTTPEFWMNLQAQHDLAVSKPTRNIKRIKRSA
ncbi:UNVERIFIED_CONTAM: hypothetical protein GTU68_054134 [Idotea baltica]|nr:hypothetical protein [Idotea baltica]